MRVSGPVGPLPAARLFLVGNIPLDLTQRVTRLPVAGEDLRTEGAQVASPGGAFHVLHAAWRSGLRGRFAGTHGSGPFGNRIRTALAGIECQVVQPAVADRDTPVVVVLVDRSGERTFVSPADSVPPFTAPVLGSLRPDPADVVYVSGYSLGLGTASAALARWVSDLPRDRLVFCDLGPWGAAAPGETLDPVLRRVDWLACNEREVAVVTGEGDPAAAAGALLRRTGGSGVLVRAGAWGCWLAQPEATPTLMTVPAVEQVVDSTGAGDAHSGAFLAALTADRSARDAVEHANAVAARVVTHTAGASWSLGFGTELSGED